MSEEIKLNKTKSSPIVFLRDVEMSSTTSTDTLNYLHQRSRPKTAEDPCVLQGADGKSYAVRRKSRFDRSLRDTIVFDAIGIQFHAGVFFYQLFIHLFFPLIFTVKNKYGQGVRMHFFHIWWNIACPIIIYIMIGTYFACSKSDQEYLGQSIFIPLMFYVVHRCILSVKYASLSGTEYERFVNCKDKYTINMYMVQIHLMGWMTLDPAVLYFELGAASARIGIKINELYLYICDSTESSISAESQFRYWNAFLRGHDTIDWDSKPAPEIKTLPSGRVGVSVYNICMALILRAAAKDSHPFYINFFLTAIVGLIIAISFVPLVSNWSSINSKAIAVIFQITSVIINAQFGYVFFSLLYLAIIDIKRQKRMVEMLHCMIRSTDLMMQNDLSVLPPHLIVSDYCRQVSDARLNAILSITDEHEYVGSSPAGTVLSKIKEGDEEEEDDEEVEDIAVVGHSGRIDEETKEFTPKRRSLAQNEFELLNDEGDGEEVTDRMSVVLGENIAREAAFALTPRVTFRYAENVIGWLYTRLTIQHFGDRFRARIDLYVGKWISPLSLISHLYHCYSIGVSLLLTLFLMLFALISVFSAANRQEAFMSVFFIQSFLAVTLLLFYLLLIFSLGAAVNAELDLHR